MIKNKNKPIFYRTQKRHILVIKMILLMNLTHLTLEMLF